ARRDRIRAVGTAFGRELTREARVRSTADFRAAVGRVCAALRSLGYQASLGEVTDGYAVITTPTCPLRPLVRAQPRLAELDRAMWTGLVAHALEHGHISQIACDTRDCQHDEADCRVLVTVRHA